MKWSDQQLKAINEIGSNILVSAGAGSGKTAVLTERIHHLVAQGTDLNKFLVLTFTNAASLEMKSRIRQKLMEDPKCVKYADQIDSAHIETFDAFSLFLVKKYAYYFGISNDVSICDGGVLAIKRKKICDEVFDEYYAKGDPNFIQLIQTFSVKSDKEIKEFVLRIGDFANLKIDKYDFLKSLATDFGNPEQVEEMIKEKYDLMQNKLSELETLTEEFINVEEGDNIANFLHSFKQFKDYDSLYLALNEISFVSKLKKGKSDDDDLRGYIKDSYDSLKPKKNDFGLSADILIFFTKYKVFADVLSTLSIEVERRFDEFKKEHNAYDFSDIARMAVTLLRDPQIKEEMKNYFTYIMVDEYQDTSDIQEEVVNALGDNNIYMVGDVKQSIYRFRNANCLIFLNKYLKYGKNDGGMKIDLNTSYRSREEVVNAINGIFSQLMVPELNLIDYKDGHEFLYGRKEYSQIVDKSHDYQMESISYSYKKATEACQAEADLIARDIIDKINNHYQVYDDKVPSKLRDAKFSDFCVIISKSNNFETIKNTLTGYGIVSEICKEESISNSELVLTVKNLVKLLYFISIGDMQSADFRHSYVSVHRSFLNKQSDQEIYNALKKERYQYSPVIQKILPISEDLSHHSLYSMLSHLFETFDIYDKIITLGNVSSNNKKLEVMLNLAKTMDSLGYNLSDFVQYFDDVSNYDLSIDLANNDSGENAVKIMTIHHSKGLEFPICYFPQLFTSFDKSNTQTSFIVDDRYGILMPPFGDYPYSNLGISLHKMHAKQEDFYERIRVLYVALTRAKERIILIRGFKGEPKYIYTPDQIKSFNDLITYSSYPMKDVVFGEETPKLNLVDVDKKEKKITLEHIEVEPLLIEHKKASKEKGEGVDQSLLDFGNEIHYLLEITNFETKDTSFIKSEKLQKYVHNIIDNPLFANIKNEQVRHEFPFYDENNNVNGIIDCLLLKDDHIDIIDFKLKNIDDENYVKQLHTYRDYIAKISDKPIDLYLISAITGEVKKIE